MLYYKGFDAEQKFIGVVFKVGKKGYSSVIETVVGMLKDGTITAIKVLSQNETPGLGSQVAEKKFTDRFNKVSFSDLASVQAITGATISSRAVVDSVKEKSNSYI